MSKTNKEVVSNLDLLSNIKIEGESPSKPEKTILIDPRIKDLGKVCIYCKVDDGFSFAGRFVNCSRHGGKSNDDAKFPCFPCISRITEDGNDTFKLCPDHSNSAKDEFRVIKLRTVTKVLKIEDTPQNANLIRNVSEKLPFDTTGSSLNDPKKITIVTYEKSNPHPLVVRTDNLNIEHVNVDDNDFKIEQSINADQQSIDLENDPLSLQDTPGEGVIINPYTDTPVGKEGVAPIPKPNSEKAKKVAGNEKQKISLKEYSQTKSPIAAALDVGTSGHFTDEVAKGWKSSLSFILRKNGINPETVRSVVHQIVALMKIHLNVYMYGSEWLVRYTAATHQEDQEALRNNQSKLVHHLDQMYKTLRAQDKADEAARAIPEIVQMLKAELDKIRTDQGAGNADAQDNLVEMAEPTEPKKKAEKIEPRDDGYFEIPFEDTFVVYSRRQLNQMIQNYKDLDVNAEDQGAGPSFRVGPGETEPEPHTYVEHRAQRGANQHQSRGNKSNKGGKKSQKRGYSQDRMDQKRAKHVEEGQNHRFTFAEIIKIGNAPGADAEARMKAKCASEIIDDRIREILKTKAKMVRGPDGDLTPAAVGTEDTKVLVYNSCGKESDWLSMPKWIIAVRNQESKKVFKL